MEIKRMDYDFSMVDPAQPFYFTGRTDEENSLVCMTENVPQNVTEQKSDCLTDFLVGGA